MPSAISKIHRDDRQRGQPGKGLASLLVHGRFTALHPELGARRSTTTRAERNSERISQHVTICTHVTHIAFSTRAAQP